MKNKIISIMLTLLILLTMLLTSNCVFGANTTGNKGIFTLNIPQEYEKINSDYATYYEMETYDSESTSTFFRVIVYNKDFFDLNLSGTMWFSHLLSIPTKDLQGFSAGDFNKEVENIEKLDYKVTKKELLTVNGYPARRLTAVDEYGFTIDEYQIVSNNYFAELYFYAETKEASQNFIDSSNQKSIINSFKFNHDTSSNCLNIPFEDVSTSSWYYAAVKNVYSNNIISGLDKKTFGPNDKLSRAMMATILYNMAGKPNVSGTSPFKDVKDSSKWYYKAVLWAAKNNIVSGYKDGSFGPNDNITREQLAVMLYKYAKYKGKNVSKLGDITKFTDYKNVASYAVTQVKWAVGAGVITGSNNKLNPKGNATRAEAASMIYKYCSNVGK